MRICDPQNFVIDFGPSQHLAIEKQLRHKMFLWPSLEDVRFQKEMVNEYVGFFIIEFWIFYRIRWNYVRSKIITNKTKGQKVLKANYDVLNSPNKTHYLE